MERTRYSGQKGKDGVFSGWGVHEYEDGAKVFAYHQDGKAVGLRVMKDANGCMMTVSPDARSDRSNAEHVYVVSLATDAMAKAQKARLRAYRSEEKTIVTCTDGNVYAGDEESPDKLGLRYGVYTFAAKRRRRV
jgi:hypothetical protein